MSDHVDATEVSDRSSNGSGRRTGDAKEIPGPSTAWTNEKHHLYLHSLEASFLKQLHQSITLSKSLQKVDCRPYSSIQDNDCNSLPRVAIQRYSKQRIKCEDLLESTSDSHFIEGSPSMDHSVSVGTEHVVSSDGKDRKRMRNTELPVSSASTQSSNDSDEWCLGDRDSGHSFLEVSDQNFVNDDSEDKSSCASRFKRSKIGTPNDQFSAFYNTEDIT